ncbi:MAG: hypothetical protein JNM18_27415 [Planctomycetaceae bacterium]|nr:hypothetical protein [Planctomycetaceae bacterium]
MISMIRWALIASLIVLGLALLYLSAFTMKTKIAWAKKVKYHETRLETLESEVQSLKLGAVENRLRHFSPYDPELNPISNDKAPQIGLRLVTDGVNYWARQRGRRWVGQTTKLDPATGGATISIEEPRPHDISATVADKEVISYQFLYAFDGREGGAAGYLGEFRVTGVKKDDTTNTIDVVPNDTLSADELKKLVANSGAAAPWHLFERLPVDSYATFANSEDTINTLLPATVRNEYLRHGQDAQPTDPPEHKVTIDGVEKYNRPLYDFMAIFRDLRARRPIINDKVLARTNDAEAMKTALRQLVGPLPGDPPVDPASPEANLKGRLVERALEITKLEKELADAMAEAMVVANAVTVLEADVATARAAVDELLAKNKALAKEIVKSQLDIQSRTPTVTAGAK